MRTEQLVQHEPIALELRAIAPHLVPSVLAVIALDLRFLAGDLEVVASRSKCWARGT